MLDIPKSNGSIIANLGWRGAWKTVSFTGGPFDAAPQTAFRVAVRAERITPLRDCDVWLPIKDFQVPANAGDVEEALVRAYRAALAGKTVYVGCMGGYGRTGLFLALLAKVAGIQNPVKWVRDTYNHRAVETKDQMRYVDEFDVSSVRRAVMLSAWASRFGFNASK